MKQEDIQFLADKIRSYNTAYRIGRPVITDAQYDALVETLREEDPGNPWFQYIEPAPVSGNRKRRLPIPMKSLNKVKSIDDLQSWVQSVGLASEDFIVITPKFDGVSLLRDETTGVVYSRGGAENEGQDCTAHYDMTASHPKNGPVGVKFTFGEFVFGRGEWNRYFVGRTSPETGELYKSPRNTAAGMINRDVPIAETVFVDYFRYGVDEESLDLFESYTDLYCRLCSHYHKKELMRQIQVKDLSDELLKGLFEEFSKLYFIDGLVIYVDNLEKWKSLGRHEGTGNPRYAIAYKNPEFTTVFETEVLGVGWKISKAGAAKPVVQIKSVDTGDCVMENPTGYNALWIKNNNVGPGAKILVTRSGGVIPKIVSTISPAAPDIPNTCPDCDTQLVWSGPELVCLAPNCPGRMLAKMIFFFRTLGAEDMGEEMFNKLFQNGFRTIPSVLNITETDILRIDGFGEGAVEVILREMEKIKRGVPLTQLMHASDCFKGIGKIKADKLLSGMSQEELQRFVSGDFRFPVDEHDVSITELNFRLGYRPFIEFLNACKIPPVLPAPRLESTNEYAGAVVCFSGVRDSKLEEKIINGGGSVVSGVSKKVTHLIVRDPNAVSTKITKAKQLGVSILSIEQFIAQF